MNNLEIPQKMRYAGIFTTPIQTKRIKINEIKLKEDIRLWLKQQDDYFLEAKGIILFDETIIQWMR